MTYIPYIDNANRPEDLDVNAFSSVGGGVMNQKVISEMDIYTRPEWTIHAQERHGVRPGFKSMLRSMGFVKGKSTPTTGHYEYPWSVDLLAVGNIITPAGGAGNDIVIELAAAAMYDSQTTVNGAASKASYPRKWQNVLLPNGDTAIIVDKDTTTDPHRFTIRPTDAATDLDVQIVANTSLALGAIEMPEGSGVPEGVTPRVVKYLNTFAIVKESAKWTGSEATNKSYFMPLPGQEGSFILKMKSDTLMRFERGCDHKLLFDRQVTNPTAQQFYVQGLGHDAPLTGTEGFLPFVSDNGNIANYVAGTIDVTDFDAIANRVEDERINIKDFCFAMGQTLYVEMENALVDFVNTDTEIFFAKDMFGYDSLDSEFKDEYQLASAEDMRVAIGFRGVHKAGLNFIFNRFHDFNDPRGVGTAAYNYKKKGILFPVGWIRDKKTAEMAGSIGYEYKSLNGLSREMMVTMLNGFGTGGRTVHNEDYAEQDYLSEIAFHGVCANHYFLFEE